MTTDLKDITLSGDLLEDTASAASIDPNVRFWLGISRSGHWVPIKIAAGPGRSGWDLATRQIDELIPLVDQHPDARLAFVQRTKFGFDRVYLADDNVLTEIPLIHARAGE